MVMLAGTVLEARSPKRGDIDCYRHLAFNPVCLPVALPLHVVAPHPDQLARLPYPFPKRPPGPLSPWIA